MSRASSVLTCTNCKKALVHQAHIRTFQNVVCCVACYEIVTNAYAKAVRLTDTVLQLYRETLRVSLVKGQANLPVLPAGEMPMGELQAAMNMLETVRANSTKEQQTGKDPV